MAGGLDVNAAVLPRDEEIGRFAELVVMRARTNEQVESFAHLTHNTVDEEPERTAGFTRFSRSDQSLNVLDHAHASQPPQFLPSCRQSDRSHETRPGQGTPNSNRRMLSCNLQSKLVNA